ncbi:MAG: TIGR00341 family protein [Deltaproteobacteria bacterium]|nr:TIGR00341 family protein [Deltaproteobacteria bacterium]
MSSSDDNFAGNWRTIWRRFRGNLAQSLGLSPDQADHEVIDRTFRDGAEFRGTNLWLLIAAIFMASIGLNVNSTAVIIGAMLISPLMGPIMAIGYGVALHDFRLVRRSLRMLAVAVAVSVATSTLYFAVSPLTQAHSELLARTSPTFWDALIALVGGVAGGVGLTRREKSNVIPGVAIATALMPPLCTAGYGLATAQPSYFFGAFYLFCINSVFIGAGTRFVMGIVGHPLRLEPPPEVRRRLRWAMYTVLIVTLLPSLFLTYRLIRAEMFRSAALAFVRTEFALPGVHAADQQIDADERRIQVTLFGDRLPPALLTRLEERMALYRLKGARLQVQQIGDRRLDVATQRTVVLAELLHGSQDTLAAQQRRIDALEFQLCEQTRAAQQAAVEQAEQSARMVQQITAQLREHADAVDADAALVADLSRDITAVFPQARALSVQPTWASATDGTPARRSHSVVVTVAPPQSAKLAAAIRRWLADRLPDAHVELR